MGKILTAHEKTFALEIGDTLKQVRKQKNSLSRNLPRGWG